MFKYTIFILSFLCSTVFAKSNRCSIYLEKGLFVLTNPIVFHIENRFKTDPTRSIILKKWVSLDMLETPTESYALGINDNGQIILVQSDGSKDPIRPIHYAYLLSGKENFKQITVNSTGRVLALSTDNKAYEAKLNIKKLVNQKPSNWFKSIPKLTREAKILYLVFSPFIAAQAYFTFTEPDFFESLIYLTSTTTFPYLVLKITSMPFFQKSINNRGKNLKGIFRPIN